MDSPGSRASPGVFTGPENDGVREDPRGGFS